MWESDTLDLIRATDPEGDIVHGGTFFGDFIPALSQSRGDGAIVWAFEPGRENYRCSEMTTVLNDLENVVLTNAGLGANGGTALLATGGREGEPLGGASRLIKDPSRVRWWDSEEVEMVTVDEIVPRDRLVSAIHLDVEGHEELAMDGALLTIERCRPLIVLETLPGAAWMAENLSPLGYQVEGSVNRNFVLRCR